MNDPSAHPTEKHLQGQTSAWIQLILPQHRKGGQELKASFLLTKIKCFSGPSPLRTTASLHGACCSLLPKAARRETEEVPERTACYWPDPARQQVWKDQNQLLPWLVERGVMPRDLFWGIFLSDTWRLHPSISVCTFSQLHVQSVVVLILPPNPPS